MKLSIIILTLGLSVSAIGQDSITLQKQYYIDAYNELVNMLEEKQALGFKRAVFITENAYLDNKFSYDDFCLEISLATNICKAFLKANQLLNYDYDDYDRVAKNAAIFQYMTDTIMLTNKIVAHYPFTYDFEDFNGEKDWTKMFVIKLLVTNSGNCHAMPILYKILADEIGTEAFLSFAPNHIYIKHRSDKTGFYNTELTSAMFPIDGWLMASGYITLESIQNAIYMDTLSLKQSVAMCLIDLAKGYERKFGIRDGNFTLQCTDLALKYYPNYVNAMLLKAETLKKIFFNIMKQHNATYPADIWHLEEPGKIYNEMEQLYINILKLGYREMPDKMYKEWLLSLKNHKEKYQDKNINIKFNPNSK